MLEKLLLLIFSGMGALLVVTDTERRKDAPWLTPERPEHDKRRSSQESENRI
jgi:hypothetical protein